MIEASQDDAIEFFNEHGYLIVNSKRQTGKTTLLKKIIESNKDKTIGVRCLSHVHYTRQFNMYSNCVYMSNIQDIYGIHFDIIIGDEIYIQPNPRVRTACAYTSKFVEFTLK
ncbi:hypothetical protein KAT92_06480 [Candidatus Babeliales bacterium]|nr:hypothetical protein [Candidatus Babeliales bacterium]